MSHYTILGSTGAVGNNLWNNLKASKHKIRLVARSYSPRKEKNAEFVKADLLDVNQTDKAVEGSDIVFLTVGLEYRTSVWESDWPQIMSNVINACKTHEAKLIFFDNVYMYGLVKGDMTEDTPSNPLTRKGEIRQLLNEMILREIKKGNVHAIIAKSADFYGPYAKLSMFYALNIEYLLKGKKPSWVIKPEVLHNFTYVPDAAKAMVILAEDKKAWDQIWHLPTAGPKTGKDFMDTILSYFPNVTSYRYVGQNTMRFFGLFDSGARELAQMYYQFDNDYVFCSDRFTNKYNFIPTSYEIGIKETVEFFQGKL